MKTSGVAHVPDAVPDRPDGSRITVRGALALPAIRRGLPEVVAGHAQLDRPVRWVHTGEAANLVAQLSGGEMLLTTGLGIGTRVADQRAFVDALADGDVAALVVELGSAMPELPAALVDAADRRELPLIALHREIPFMAVTEAMHAEIISSHYAVLSRAEQTQRRLSGLLLDGEGIPEVLAALADTLGAPVFLEDANGRLIADGAPVGYDLNAIDVWEAHISSRPGTVRARPVRSAPRQPQGRLFVVDVPPTAEALADAVLDHAADIVGLALLREHQEEELHARGRGGFLANLADGRVAPTTVERTAAVAGVELPTLLLPMTAQARTLVTVADGEWNQASREIQRRLGRVGLKAIVGRRANTSSILGLVPLAEASRRRVVADMSATILREVLTERGWVETVTVAVGRVTQVGACGAELRLTEDAAASAAVLPERPWHDISQLELRRLLWRMRKDSELSGLVDRVLGPLLVHDRRRKLALLPTLETLLAHGGRKAEAARELHLNRQALYHRLSRIEELLDVDLGDAEQLLTLHVAIHARRYLDKH